MIVPAVALGGFVVFLVFYLMTAAIRCGIVELGCRVQPNRRKPQADGDVDPVAAIVGILAVVLLVLSLFILPREWVKIVWTGLTVVGILAGISTFFLFGPETGSASGRKYQRSTPTGVPPKPVDRPPQATPRSAQTRPHGDPYRELLARVLYDKGVADRLIEYERKRAPYESSDELCRSAIDRLQRDNR